MKIIDRLNIFILIIVITLSSCYKENNSAKKYEFKPPVGYDKSTNLKITLDSSIYYRWKDIDYEKTSLVQQIEIVNDTNTILPFKLTNFPNVKILDFYACNYSDIPNNIENLTNLEELILNYTYLEKLPGNIAKLKKLKKIMINKHDCFNQYSCEFSLTDWIGKMQGLESLTFVDCIINELPNEFGNQKDLKELIFKHSNFDEFPKILEEMNSLERLVIINHKELELPKSMKSNENLTILGTFKN